MIHDPNLLWLSISPHLKCFDRRLLAQLVKTYPVRTWEYAQTADEPCCLDSVVAALHEYVSDRTALARRSGQAEYKIHLLGHGISGVVALMYARCYPQHVASLTLLSVNAKPAVNWQAHYYALRQLLPCSREMILVQMAQMMFGHQPARFSKALAELLARDLDSSLSLHSLAHDIEISVGATDVSLLVCNGEQDAIVQAQRATLWRQCMKPEDRIWQCPEGHHFFHFHHAELVASLITKHINQHNQTRAQNESSHENSQLSHSNLSRRSAFLKGESLISDPHQ
ncbi:MAG: alpha/beta hydrolase [Cyanobacteria bacterium J06621_11]